ncbi:MAG: site-2 protease family protein, partial [Gemmatimonadales bacterium]
FPVTISPTFLILGLLLLDARLGWQGSVAWVAAAFVSIMVHELGHALTVRKWGGVVQGITLHGLGGATAWADPRRRITWNRRIGIAAAGAGLGFLVAGAVFGLVRTGLFGQNAANLIPTPFRVFLGTAADQGRWLIFFLGAFIWVTMAWGLVNWLPIGGLDGWHIMAELLDRWLPGRGRRIAGVLGLLIAIGAGWFLFTAGFRIGAFILILFSVQTLMATRAPQAGSEPPAVPQPPAQTT